MEILNEGLQEIIENMADIRSCLEEEGLEVDSIPTIMQLCIYNAIKNKVQ